MASAERPIVVTSVVKERVERTEQFYHAAWVPSSLGAAAGRCRRGSLPPAKAGTRLPREVRPLLRDCHTPCGPSDNTFRPGFGPGGRLPPTIGGSGTLFRFSDTPRLGEVECGSPLYTLPSQKGVYPSLPGSWGEASDTPLCDEWVYEHRAAGWTSRWLTRECRYSVFEDGRSTHPSGLGVYLWEILCREEGNLCMAGLAELLVTPNPLVDGSPSTAFEPPTPSLVTVPTGSSTA